MEYSEKTTFLSPEDIGKLKQSKRLTMIIVPIFMVVFLSIMFFVLSNAPVFVIVVFGSFVMLFFLIMLFVIAKQFKAINRDLNDGNKKIITGTVSEKIIEGKKSKNPAYYLVIGKQKIKADIKQFNMLAQDSKAEIHIAPHSQTILKTEQLDDGKIETATQKEVKDETQQKNTNKIHASPKANVREGLIIETSGELDYEEKKLLKKIRNIKLLTQSAIALLLCYIAYHILIFIFVLFVTSDSEILNYFEEIRLIIIAVTGFIAIRIVSRNISPLFRDVSNMMKIVRKYYVSEKMQRTKLMPVQNKEMAENNWQHAIRIESMYYAVNQRIYNSLNVNDAVNINVAPESGIILSLKKADHY